MKYFLTLSLFAVVAIFFASLLISQKDSKDTPSVTWQSNTRSVSLTPTQPPSTSQGDSSATPSLSPSKPAMIATSPSNAPKTTNVLGATASPTAPTPTPLFLSVVTPLDNQIVTTQTLSVRGKTVPNAEVFIDDLTLRSDSTGTFSTMLQLEEGENLINIAANDASGNYSERELMVTYTKP